MTAFVSDNTSGVHPAIIDAMLRENSAYQLPYGDDDLSQVLDDTYSELFGCELAVLPCLTGTAANSLALSLIARPFNSICVFADSHVYRDECNAPEFFTGGARMAPIQGAQGKMDTDELRKAMAVIGDVHSAQPSAVSIAQATELGTLYQLEELAVIYEIAQQYQLKVHMDGARFANAVAALDCHPSAMSWKSGVDVLSFGATKNGCIAAEAIILFDTSYAEEARYRLKRSGQLTSKQRFLSAQLLAYVRDDLWLSSARHANAQAASLVASLSTYDNVEFLHDDKANMLFVRFAPAQVTALQSAGLAGYVYEGGYMRLCCSWSTTDEELDKFLAVLGGANAYGKR